MKKVLKRFFQFLCFIYFIIAIFAIICLVKRNEYGLPQFGDTTLIIIKGEEMNEYYKDGDLIIIKKPKNDDVKVNDAVFFYDTQFKRNTINIATIVNKEVINESETTYHVKGTSFSSSYLVGKIDGSIKYGGIGSVLSVLTSRWGFLFLIILPFFILFMWELLAIYLEIKRAMKSSE